jgi:hypothetical protein
MRLPGGQNQAVSAADQARNRFSVRASGSTHATALLFEVPLSRYSRRWLVERFFAWIQWQRRVLVRWEYHPENFLGFVQLACLLVLFRRF